MKHIPIRLGPLALLLTVISICMTTLGILAFTTARADLRLAEKYADTVYTRYGLEAEGQTFLREAAEACRAGREIGSLPGTETDETGTVWRIYGSGDFSLRIGLTPEESGFKVTGWYLQREWEPENNMGNLWLGN